MEYPTPNGISGTDGTKRNFGTNGIFGTSGTRWNVPDQNGTSGTDGTKWNLEQMELLEQMEHGQTSQV
ncbi:hypothetical protein GCM10010967_00470 [Dyadobacter beijingensis]|uniref:Uncharacterized protein n=1 Tax=Dyadobacter beijingensis TaxID=365489 RepID=A0ABQ2HCU9_9BACT|nr:hypothetical protein GCM10010967_00470 [Dyadobacter beijingensis]